MLTLREILDMLRTHRASLAQRYGIRSMAVFGPSVRQEQQPQSDLDLLVELERPLGSACMDLADEFESILGMRVDLVSRDALNERGYESIAADLQHV
jgi:predicted nucleotidyltransferase